MNTVTFFRDMDFPIHNGTIAYLQDNTYADVSDDAALMAVEKGVGEIVPDSILGDPDAVDDGQIEPPITKISRTRMKKKWPA